MSLRTGLLWALGLGLLGFVCLTLARGHLDPAATTALWMATVWVPPALCWSAVHRDRLLLARIADLRHLAAASDEPTGLPNRRALVDEGRARLTTEHGRRLALLVLDLDKFREVNDSLGHHAGDQLLVRVGARLREHLGASDMLARFGSDEFAVLLDGAGRDEAVAGAVRLQAALDEPFTLQDIALHSSVSVGIALFPDDGADLNTLLSKAGMAMYKAKTSLPSHHVCYTDDDDASRLQTVEELDQWLRIRPDQQSSADGSLPWAAALNARCAPGLGDQAGAPLDGNRPRVSSL